MDIIVLSIEKLNEQVHELSIRLVIFGIDQYG